MPIQLDCPLWEVVVYPHFLMNLNALTMFVQWSCPWLVQALHFQPAMLKYNPLWSSRATKTSGTGLIPASSTPTQNARAFRNTGPLMERAGPKSQLQPDMLFLSHGYARCAPIHTCPFFGSWGLAGELETTETNKGKIKHVPVTSVGWKIKAAVKTSRRRKLRSCRQNKVHSQYEAENKL